MTLRGIVIQLNTGTAREAGTNDSLYLGVSGTAGGREFPLDVAWFDDFERRSRVKYRLGKVWDEVATAGSKQPKMSHADWNDPAYFYVGFDAIDRLYLRKQSSRSATKDDAYELDEIEVTLFADEPRKRIFRCTTGIWLGTAYGSQVWLPEVGEDEQSVSLRT
ncbi:MAG: hypothetical protein JRG95_04690 [Deltaproteobacteria bacterium]|nr:hypothetical protein [Deltaproteobacteria bacterium]